MVSTKKRRVPDAEVSREAVLNAAEEEFAHNGFSGARIDAIAAASGYNKSLIFHYYSDKVGLYAAVIGRIEQYINRVRKEALTMVNDDFSNLDAQTFKTLLSTVVRTIFDVLQERPHLRRILGWEAAEEWKTFKVIAAQFDINDIPKAQALIYKAYEAGLLRPNLDPAILIPFVLSICLSYPAFSPLYHEILKSQQLSPIEMTLHVREQLVTIVLHGVLADLA